MCGKVEGKGKGRRVCEGGKVKESVCGKGRKEKGREGKGREGKEREGGKKRC